MDTMEEAKQGTRRRHDSELKRQVLAQCAKPGASVAKVAMAHSLNSNLVHKWRRESLRERQRGEVFVPVALPAPAAAASSAASIQLQMRRGALAVEVRWPLEAASECAAWLREILK